MSGMKAPPSGAYKIVNVPELYGDIIKARGSSSAASAAVVTATNCLMSAPAMKPSGLPLTMTTPRRVASFSI